MNALALLTALALSAPPHVAGPSLNLGGGAPVAVASGILDWSRSWSQDWTTGTSTPTPTIECEAAAADGEMTCVGATATKVGSPTTVSAPGYPARWAARLSGSGQYYNLGDVDAFVGDFTLLVTASAAGTSTMGLVSKDNGSTWRQFQVRYSSGLISTVGPIIYTLGAVSQNTTFDLCLSFDAETGPGTSTILANLNGNAVAPNTTAGVPVENAVPLVIGAQGLGTNPWTGDITYLAIVPRAFTAAECAAAVASQQARLASKPLGALVTVSSPATTCVTDGTATGALYNLPANSLCAHSTGVDIFGAAEHSNLFSYSSPAAWTLSNVTGDDVSASCPLWVDGATRMDLLTSTGADPTASTDAANSRCRCVWLALPTAANAHDVTMSDASGDGPQTVTLSATPTRVCATATGHTGIKLAWTNGNNVCAMRGTGQNAVACDAANPAPQATGTPISGAPDLPKVDSQIASVTKWAIGIKATPVGTNGWARGSAIGLLHWGGAAASANSVDLSVDAAAKVVLTVYDNAGTPAAKTWTSTDALTGTAEKSIIATNSGGTWSVYVDGVAVAGSLSGTGTGIQTALPATNTLSEGLAGTTSLNGAARKVCQAADFKGCKRWLQ